ncbi:hypothetical protein GCM10010411_74480 [Actinomadura fulvescens]|uniref:Uncharacterized protein n=1 Tax=Actinomadura fulvescens TaxID=46160 RepID=A0ABP6CX49_9ACTN
MRARAAARARARRPTGHPAITDPAARAWAAREDLLALHGILHTLPARWINHPAAAAAANHKAHQLVTAHACGLPVPDTLFTTSGTGVAAWAGGRRILYKAHHAQGADHDTMVTATPADPAQLPHHLGAASCFQPIIDGPSIRVTVIGHQQFAVRITGGPPGLVDWRPVQDRLHFTPIPVPSPVTAGLRRFMTRYGLEYGAFDFIQQHDGTWVFLGGQPFRYVRICGDPIRPAHHRRDRLPAPHPHNIP